MGIECELPDAPKKGVDGSRFKPKDQHFRRTKIPAFMDSVVRDADWTCMNQAEDGALSPLTREQEDFINQEADRCIEGYWFMRKGEATWIPGTYYYFLNYWTTEDGAGYSSEDRKIEYRSVDREFFIFFATCYDHPVIRGIVRGKKVREGATTQGTCLSVHIAAFNANQNCGTLSNKGDNAKITFTSMITKGFYDSPIWLQPRYDSSERSQATKLQFVAPRSKSKDARSTTKRSGNNSMINWERTSTSSYVNIRLSYILVDEAGRMEELDIYKFWNNVMKDRVSRGASKTGFAYLPTAVNEPDKGGRNFAKLWDASNQFGPAGIRTSTGLIKWFKEAWYGYSGFIDKYGDDVIEPPDAETLQYLVDVQSMLPRKERIPKEDLMLGARGYLERQRSELTGDDEALSAHRRNYPFEESDMFDFGEQFNPFDREKLQAQIKYLKDHPQEAYWRRGRLVYYEYLESGERGHNIRFHDDPNGPWLIREPPKIPNAFFIDDRNICRPLATHLYGGGMDTYKFDKTKELGSNAAICIGSKLDISKPEGDDGGEMIAFYIDRPKLTEYVWAEMLKVELWYGCTITAEQDATQEYKKYHKNTMPNFLNANCMPMLGRKPDAAIDPERKVSVNNFVVEHGISSADKFIFAKQIELGVIYVFKYSHKIKLIYMCEQLMALDIDHRTKYDAAIAFLVMLLNITGDFRQQRVEQKQKEALVRRYTVGHGLTGFMS
jgi:hypothetical protein